MSMTNENSQERWELGDAISIRLDPVEPDPEEIEPEGEDTTPA